MAVKKLRAVKMCTTLNASQIDGKLQKVDPNFLETDIQRASTAFLTIHFPSVLKEKLKYGQLFTTEILPHCWALTCVKNFALYHHGLQKETLQFT